MRINKNKSFDEEEGNLVKMKMENVSVSLEMFDTNEENININSINIPMYSIILYINLCVFRFLKFISYILTP